MVSTPRRRLLERPSTPSARWDPDPPPDGAVEAAYEYFSQRLTSALRAAALSPNDLASALGGTEGAWRHKFNGTRLWTLEDAITVVLAFGIDLPEPFWQPGADLSTLLPPEYRARLRPRRGRLPELSDAPQWDGIASELDAWLTAEHRRGRHMAITAATAFHQVLVVADVLGLPSQQATLQLRTAAAVPHAVVDWAAKNVRLALYWEPPWATAAATSAPTRFLEAVATEPRDVGKTHVAVTLTTPVVAANLQAHVGGSVGAVVTSDDLKRAGVLSGGDSPPTTFELLAVGHAICMARLR